MLVNEQEEYKIKMGFSSSLHLRSYKRKEQKVLTLNKAIFDKEEIRLLLR